MKKKIRIVLLGATGFVGSALLKKASEIFSNNIQIRALVRGKYNGENYPFLKIYKGHLPDQIPGEIFFNEPYVVVHFATKKIDFDSSGFEEVNITGTENLLSRLNDSCQGILYGSSMSVYGQGEQVEVTENEEIVPDTELAKSRVKAEGIITVKMKDAGKSSILLRSRVIIGKEDKFTIPSYIKSIKKNVIPGDGSQSFSIISVDDYAEIILKISEIILNSEDKINTALNVGYKKPVSINEIINSICNIMNLKKPGKYIKLNKPVVWLMKYLPVKKLQNLAIQMELGSYSHWADVSKLQSLVGNSIVDKNPVEVLEKVLIEFRNNN